jgi:hypothetical protein
MAISFFLRVFCIVCSSCVHTIHAMDKPLPIHISPPKIHFENDPVVTTDSANCIIPFSRVGNLIIIRAKADTLEGNFIFDTGAPGLVLNLTYFRNYTTVEHYADVQGGVTGSVESGGRIAMDSFSFAPVRYSRLEADRINLGHIENSKGIKILGLLGMQLFKKFEIIIDYENSVIYMHLLTKKDGRNYKSDLLKDTSKYVETAIDFIENKLITYAYSAGKKLSFVLDTGAESNLIDSRLPAKVLDGITVSRRVFITGTGSARVEALSGSMSDIKIGSYDINRLPVIVTNLEKLCYAYDRCLDGMLGFDFFSQQKIGFNFVKRKMYIWK